MPDTSRLSDPNVGAWWTPNRHRDRRPLLLARNRIKTAIRAYFLAHGFVEVDTCCLQRSPGNETHVHAFPTLAQSIDGRSHPLYLHTSPEFACKKLLAAGEPRIFTFAPVFRNRERSNLHHPEFTMLEWYQAGADYTRLMDHCADILGLAADSTENRDWQFADRRADPRAPVDRMSVADAVQKFAAIDLLATLGQDGPDRDRLFHQATATGIRCSADDTWSDIFTRILLERVEPHLGIGGPAILDAYPICEAALARPSPSDARVGERFELYCCGVELANGFGELTDPQVQRRRFAAEMDEKHRIYGQRYPIDEEFLTALNAMPPASGCALGFDRLVMLATGAQRVEHVIWTPVIDPFAPRSSQL